MISTSATALTRINKNFSHIVSSMIKKEFYIYNTTQYKISLDNDWAGFPIRFIDWAAHFGI